MCDGKVCILVTLTETVLFLGYIMWLGVIFGISFFLFDFLCIYFYIRKIVTLMIPHSFVCMKSFLTG